MLFFACIGIAACVIIGVPAVFIALDCACAKIARALRDAMRP